MWTESMGFSWVSTDLNTESRQVSRKSRPTPGWGYLPNQVRPAFVDFHRLFGRSEMKGVLTHIKWTSQQDTLRATLNNV